MGGLSPNAATTLSAADGIGFGSSAATAGDVNGDGYADVIVGAFSAYVVGRAEVFAGNDGYGLAHAQRTRTASGGAPVAYLGRTDTLDTFRLVALGRTPFGRGLVTLQWEVKPLGVVFDGQGLQQGPGWFAATGTGVQLEEVVTTLNSNPAQHWRLRILYKPSATPYAQHSRWLTQPWNGWNETRLRTDRLRVFIPLARR